jgi:two-component system, chemotaxis family, sensor kinase CheA
VTSDSSQPVVKESQSRPKGLSIRGKLLCFIIALCCLLLGALATAAFYLSANALRDARFGEFRTLRRSLSSAVNTSLANKRRDLATQAELQTFRDAIAELGAAYDHILEDLDAAGFKVDEAFIDDLRRQLRQEYDRSLLLALKDLGHSLDKSEWVSDLSSQGVLVQYVYLLRNPANQGSKFLNNLSGDIAKNEDLPKDFRLAFAKTMFARTIDRYHSSFETVVRGNGYDDLILINANGDVIYTFNKAWDFGTNVLKGWQSHAHLKRVFLGAWYTPFNSAEGASPEHVVVTDFERYPAAYDVPLMFLGCPITSQTGSRIGVLVHQIATYHFTNIVSFNQRWTEAGLGNTGEAYIVGSDKKLRTEPRFLNLLPPEYKTRAFLRSGVPGPPTAILNTPLSNSAVSRVFSSDGLTSAGEATFSDEIGRESLGSFGPLNIPDLDWGIVVRMDTAEAFAPASHLTRLIIEGGLVLLLFAAIATIFISHFLSKQILELVAAAEKVASGDLTARAPVTSRDEIGFLARRFNKMIGQVEGRNRQVRKILETVNEALFLIGVDFVIQPECSRATEDIFRGRIEGINFLTLLERGTPGGLQPVISEEVRESTKHYLELLLNPRVKEKLVRKTNPLNEVEFRYRDYQGKIKSRFVEFRFNRVMEDWGVAHIMVTALDVTFRVSLSKQIRENEEKSKSQIERLFGVMHVNPPILSEFLENADLKIGEMLHLLEAEQFGAREQETDLDRSSRYSILLHKIFRTTHLIKGDAATLRLAYFEELAHQVEGKIAELRNSEPISGEQLLPITSALGSLRDQVQMTRDVLNRISPKAALAQSVGRNGAADGKALISLAADIATRSGKQARVHFSAGLQPEHLPKRLREPVQSILSQLVRNAVVHGIEAPSGRLEKKKPPVGTIEITLVNERDRQLIVTVRDDGQGINYGEVRSRAVELGYATPSEIKSWNETQLTSLLYRAGFTTLRTPTSDAGRGVGLDAVKDLASRLGGSLSLRCQEDEYCELRVELPF